MLALIAAATDDNPANTPTEADRRVCSTDSRGRTMRLPSSRSALPHFSCTGGHEAVFEVAQPVDHITGRGLHRIDDDAGAALPEMGADSYQCPAGAEAGHEMRDIRHITQLRRSAGVIMELANPPTVIALHEMVRLFGARW